MTDQKIGAARLFVAAMGIVATGLAIWTGWQMFDHQVSTEELLLWIAAAWAAWTAVIALEVWIWTRRNADAIRGVLAGEAPASASEGFPPFLALGVS